MSINIHKLENNRVGEMLLSISDSEFAELGPAINLFKAKMGLFIDQYSDLRLSSGVQPLIEALENSSNASEIYSLLLGVLRKSETDGYGIINVGN